MRDLNRTTDVMVTGNRWHTARPEQVGAFRVEKHGDESVRLVMREPHFANNVRYSLSISRSTSGRLVAQWSDSEDTRPCSWLEVGVA